jgi:hypothetical protein
MSEFQPLNPTLFNLLRLHFGEVDVVAAGQAIDWRVAARPEDSRSNGEQRKSRKVRASGEEYKVNCPFCHDQRKRLYINHRWGVLDEETNNRNLFLCQCWNEQCVDTYPRQKQLEEWVFSSAAGRTRDGEMAVRQGAKTPTSVCEVAPPGVLIRLDELKASHPHHDAIAYLEGRGFDIQLLADKYDISFCPHSKFSLARNRIIIPMYRDGMLVNWQARYVGDDVHGVKFSKARVAKFWTCPNSARRLIAYNMEVAVQHKTILIVEGPTDVWSAGPQSMALLGKKMNPGLYARFMALLGQYHPDQKPIVCIVLDPEQDERERVKGKPHHIELLLSMLTGILRSQVFGLYLPEGCDPGNIERLFLRDLVKQEAAKRGLKASFAKPKELVL